MPRGWRWKGTFKRFQTWNIYWDNIIQEKSAAVRGYEKLL